MTEDSELRFTIIIWERYGDLSATDKAGYILMIN